jgi:hypothetical protein
MPSTPPVLVNADSSYPVGEVIAVTGGIADTR